MWAWLWKSLRLFIWKDRKKSYTIHIEVPPNPFWASIGLIRNTASVGSVEHNIKRGISGYLNQSFQNAVMEGVGSGMEQGLYGWGVTDCQICFDCGVYYSLVKFLLIFVSLRLLCWSRHWKSRNTTVGTIPSLPFLHLQEYLSRADAPALRNHWINQTWKDEVIFMGTRSLYWWI